MGSSTVPKRCHGVHDELGGDLIKVGVQEVEGNMSDKEKEGKSKLGGIGQQLDAKEG